jgi:BON domain
MGKQSSSEQIMKKALEERDRAAAEARHAVQDAAQAVRDLAAALIEQTREAGLDERAGELAGKIQAGSRELSSRTREWLSPSGLEERASELAGRVRESEPARQARERAARLSDEALARVGQKLASGKTAEKLHVQPAKRSWPGWLLALVGVAAGYAVGMLTAPKRGQQLREDLAGAAEGLASKGSQPATGADRASGPGLETRGGPPGDDAAPPAQTLLADQIRTRLGEDARTKDLPRLNINVAEGTVFVRGTVPEGFDESAIRQVIGSVAGVTDVDLQVSASS